MKLFFVFLILLSISSYGQENISNDFLVGKWTLQWGQKYGAIKYDEGRKICDTTDCTGEWNYEFFKNGRLQFYSANKDSIYLGFWSIKDSILECRFDTGIRLYPLKKLSFTRLEAEVGWNDETTDAQSVNYLHFKRN